MDSTPMPSLSLVEALAYELVAAMRIGESVRAMTPPPATEAERLVLSEADHLVEEARTFSRDITASIVPSVESVCVQVLIDTIPEEDLRGLAELYRRDGFADRFQSASVQMGQAVQVAVETAMRSKLNL